MDLLDATKKIEADAGLAKEFAEDPLATLGRMGVDTTGLMVKKQEEDAQVKGLGLCVKVCASVGAPIVGCHEVGKNVGT